jgi:release factor glutamine methyltransferase
MNLNDCPLPQPTTSRLGDWLKNAGHQMESVSGTPALEAQMAACYVLGKPRTWIIAHPEIVIPADKLARLTEVLALLAVGYPFAYITGEREFFGRLFEVRPGLLVPRPETEMLVETAINWLHAHPEKRSVVDVGCGTGCIAVTLAAEINTLQVEALDIDPLALETTRNNAERLGTANLVVKKSDLLAGFTGMIDLICANLPYVPSKTVDTLPAARHESRLALDGGPDGLRLIETLLDQAASKLLPGGLILLEIETSQGQAAQVMARQYFPEAEISLRHDLAGHPRLVSIQI